MSYALHLLWFVAGAACIIGISAMQVALSVGRDKTHSARGHWLLVGGCAFIILMAVITTILLG